MLDHVTIKGFKSIASIEQLKLRPINVVIGANGSGKSNFLGAFAFLHAISEGRLQDYVTTAGGAERVVHFGSKTTRSVEFHLSFESGVDLYKLTLSTTADDGLFPSQELYSDADRRSGIALQAWKHGREAGISSPTVERPAIWVRNFMGGWRLYHLNDTSSSSPMRKTAKVEDKFFLRPDGANVADFLWLLREKYESEYSLIVRTVQRVAPFFEDFLLEPRRPDSAYIHLGWRHTRSDQYFDASSLSDGTLRFIILATLFLQPREHLPRIILVDEPELGLHPYAIEMLAALVRQASATAQVILSTQSTLLLDHFEPEDVLVAERVDGGTQLRRLESPQLTKWLENYSLGQLWEKNELGGRPVPG